MSHQLPPTATNRHPATNRRPATNRHPTTKLSDEPGDTTPASTVRVADAPRFRLPALWYPATAAAEEVR